MTTTKPRGGARPKVRQDDGRQRSGGPRQGSGRPRVSVTLRIGAALSLTPAGATLAIPLTLTAFEGSVAILTAADGAIYLLSAE